MSEPIICEYCGSNSKNKNTLYIHQKGAAKCIKMQIEKLGKPLYELKQENKKEKKEKTKVETKAKSDSENDSESEEDENQEIPFISSSEDDIDIQISSDESESESPKEEVVKPKFSNTKLLFKKKELSPAKENREITPRKSLKHPELMSEINDIKKQEINIDTKEIVSSILNALNSKDNKVIEEIKKLRDELKNRDEEAQKRDETLRKSISKLEKTLNDCNPSSTIEIIKRIQAEVETKDDLLQIFKEDLEETLDKYYELYKKLKDIKYDMEDMVYGKDK